MEYMAKLPENAIIVSNFTITNFIDHEGKDRHAISMDGDISLNKLIGAWEAVKFQLLLYNVAGKNDISE